MSYRCYLCSRTAPCQTYHDQLGFPDISNLSSWKAIDSTAENCGIDTKIFIFEDGQFVLRRVPMADNERFADLMM